MDSKEKMKTARFVVAGIPRCGTTMMARAVATLPPSRYWHKEPINEVIKRHLLFYPEDMRGIERGVFLYGDIISAVLSTRRARMDERHLKNCGCHKPIKEVDILHRDDLNYELIFDVWTKPQVFPMIYLRYEKLWDNADKIDEFFGRHIELPPKKERITKPANFSIKEIRLIRNTYKSLISKVCKMPDMKIIE